MAYPEAVSLLPVPQLWSVLFFFMLFTLGIDSEFALMETVLTAIYDAFPKLVNHKPKVCASVCAACFIIRLELTSVQISQSR